MIKEDKKRSADKILDIQSPHRLKTSHGVFYCTSSNIKQTFTTYFDFEFVHFCVKF